MVIGLALAVVGCGADPDPVGDSATSGASSSTGASPTTQSSSGASNDATGSASSGLGTSGSTSASADTSGTSSVADTSGSASGESGGSSGGQVDPSEWDCEFLQTAVPGGSAGDLVVRSTDENVVAIGFEGEDPRGLHLERFDYGGVSQGETSVLDPASMFQFRLTPRAAWNGSAWGVVYGARSNASPDTSARFALVDEEGNVLEGPTIISGMRVNEVQIVWTGEEFAMVWRDSAGNLLFGQVDEQGTSATDLELLQNVPSIRSHALSLVQAGNELGLAWTRSGDVEFQRLSLDGAPLTEPAAVASEIASPPEFVWRGDRYTGIAIAEPAAGERVVRLFDLAPNGTPMGEPVDLMEGAEHREFNNSYAAHSLGLADQGEELGVVFLATREGDISPEVYFQRVAYDGEQLGDELPVSDPNAMFGSIDPSLQWTGSGYLAAWRGNSEPSGWNAWVRSVCPR